MSTVNDSAEVCKVSEVLDHDNVPPEEAQGSPEATSDNTLSGATDAEQKKFDDYAATEDRVVELAISTLDPKDMLKKYAKLGGEAVKLAAKRKASLKSGSWNGAKDLAKVCDDLETLVKMRVAIKDVRMMVYMKVCLWVTAVKVLVPEVERLSYYQVVNKFLPTLEFDAEALTGEIRSGWIGWVTSTVTQQLGDEPMSMADLDAAIRGKNAEITREKTAKRDPEKALEQEQKAAEAKVRSERKAGQSKISDAIDKALVADHANAADVVDIVGKVLRDHKIEMPPTGFNAATATPNDVKMLARQLMTAGKYMEMVVLRDTLDAMIKIVDNARATAQSKVA